MALPTGGKENKSADSSYNRELTQRELLERELEQILSRVEGVGEVQVLLTWQEEKALFSENTVQGTVTGILVAAKGADNPVVIRNIQQAVMALFQVEAHKIKVMKMK